jgi:hypothetical protein
MTMASLSLTAHGDNCGDGFRPKRSEHRRL